MREVILSRLTPPSCTSPTVFSSLAVATGNQTDSRGSLISVDSNPSNSDRNSEKMDGCEKVKRKKKSIVKFSIFFIFLLFIRKFRKFSFN